MKNNLALQIIGAILLIVGLIFYWYELRPANIKKECLKIATDLTTIITSKRSGIIGWGIEIPEYPKSEFSNLYKGCLIKKGL